MDIEEKSLLFLLNAKQRVEQLLVKSSVEVINTYNSLCVVYTLSIDNVYSDFKLLEANDFNVDLPNQFSRSLWRLPVCYSFFGIDMDAVSISTGLSKEEIIEHHTKPDYLLYFIGFLPGFLYLGGLENSIATPRRNTPRASVQKGAVGIAENQTGIYPDESPGGWQIIGNCPINLFNIRLEKPSLFSAGDKIQFYEIDEEEHQNILTQSQLGNYHLIPEKI